MEMLVETILCVEKKMNGDEFFIVYYLQVWLISYGIIIDAC